MRPCWRGEGVLLARDGVKPCDGRSLDCWFWFLRKAWEERKGLFLFLPIAEILMSLLVKVVNAEGALVEAKVSRCCVKM